MEECEELKKDNLGKNHIIGYFPKSKITTSVFNFDYFLSIEHKRNSELLNSVGGGTIPIGMTMNTDFFFFHFCPICGEKIDTNKYMNLIYENGKLF